MSNQTIKLIVLTNGQNLISQIEEVTTELGEPDCKLVNPFIITTSEEKITMQEGVAVLRPWLLNITKDDIFMISSDKILTLADPMPTLLEKYLDLTKE